jgi:hypothetical protein
MAAYLGLKDLDKKHAWFGGINPKTPTISELGAKLTMRKQLKKTFRFSR